MMQVSKRVPFDDPFVLNVVRAIYLASNVLIAGLYLFTQLKINKKKGTPTPQLSQDAIITDSMLT